MRSVLARESLAVFIIGAIVAPFWRTAKENIVKVSEIVIWRCVTAKPSAVGQRRTFVLAVPACWRVGRRSWGEWCHLIGWRTILSAVFARSTASPAAAAVPIQRQDTTVGALHKPALSPTLAA